MSRISIVQDVKLRSMLFSSMVQVGDNVAIDAGADILAVQRELPIFRGDEGDMRQIPIFSQQLTVPIIDEQVDVKRINTSGRIEVGSVDILGLSVASVLQIGSNRSVTCFCRTKHIRQLIAK